MNQIPKAALYCSLHMFAFVPHSRIMNQLETFPRCHIYTFRMESKFPRFSLSHSLSLYPFEMCTCATGKSILRHTSDAVLVSRIRWKLMAFLSATRTWSVDGKYRMSKHRFYNDLVCLRYFSSPFFPSRLHFVWPEVLKKFIKCVDKLWVCVHKMRKEHNWNLFLWQFKFAQVSFCIWLERTWRNGSFQCTHTHTQSVHKVYNMLAHINRRRQKVYYKQINLFRE